MVSNCKVVVLFVQSNSVYKKLGCDAYDIKRNAMLYNGNQALIAHPPCRLWSRLRACSTAPVEEKLCAIHALNLIRRNGGVLEHPNGSSLWKEMGISKSTSPDQFGGFTISVNQSWFGHKARKSTLLYIVGCTYAQLPTMPLNFDAITHSVTTTKRDRKLKVGRKECSKHMRDATPLLFANWLIEVIAVINSNK